MNDSIITVENLGRRYSILHDRERYVALRDPTSDLRLPTSGLSVSARLNFSTPQLLNVIF